MPFHTVPTEIMHALCQKKFYFVFSVLMGIQENDRWAQMGIGVIPTRQDLPSKWKQPQGCSVAHNSPDLVSWGRIDSPMPFFLIMKKCGMGGLVQSIERTQPNSGFNLLLMKIFYDPSLQFSTPVDLVGR